MKPAKIVKMKLDESQKRTMRKVLDANRAMNGNSWREYTEEEIVHIYGFLPSWAVRPTN